ncbi:NAD(P)/FAD-dependent oxidoreductase [Roseobacter sinensis]|uniref:FAD-binding oxidoreductase n=1 Tax=Roseobacter sinensis TaxID=2931391 RepID=A0ABT3B8L6_9RHOB|nr:FAD-binding oxidoreductase [Roseobacter sp. WL0113]MCV3269905.1 FAD-binding oxidoreductase [Roseobacter sp. WL0113]
MNRIFADYAYGNGPRESCWWDETCRLPERSPLMGSSDADVVIIGAGFTGLSAAYHLARAGLNPVVLDARFPGWGASGRNGGFCCLGGGVLGDAQLDAGFGKAGRLEFRAAEKAAVALVSELVDTLSLDVDQHSHGETQLAHHPRQMDMLRKKAETVEENYGVAPVVIERAHLPDAGLGGPFFGALTVPVGFGLNPLKYLLGLAAAAEQAGAVIHHDSAVEALGSQGDRHRVKTALGAISCRHVVVATNGYSSEDLPGWLRGRYMPCQSNVLVTRPLTEGDILRQGWSSDQMCYDTRHLLHYFRLMPDRRFLFGMRGGLITGAAAETRARRRIRRDFVRLFPQWAHVETAHVWSGMVCLGRIGLPFVGETMPGSRLWAGLCYHGNGIAMGTLSGKILAELIEGRTPSIWPEAMRRPLAKFPFGRWRRIAMPPIYLGLMLADRG